MDSRKLYQHPLYQDDLDYVSRLDLPWDRLQGKRILLSGASGLVGSFLVDVLMTKNRDGLDCEIHALTRNAEKTRNRFTAWEGSGLLRMAEQDIIEPVHIGADSAPMDFVLHLASNTHPLQYAKDPIGTITTNMIGLHNMLTLAAEQHAERFLFASSNEIYGENRGDTELFREDYCGYLNCNTLRAGYPESKRCGEALCQAYRVQKGLDVVIPRLTRSYGPTVLPTDTKAVSQFIRKGVSGEDIVLKSAGTQYYSYTYAADAVSGLLTVLLKGKDGEAYNIADEASDIMLKDLAALIAKTADRKVIFELPDAVETAGYSTATKARLDGSRAKEIGWKPRFAIGEGIPRTIRILRETV